jgi:pimeloyl-ACP methyl ester carboxylesterase
MSGYHGNDAASSEATWTDSQGRRWLRTGDLGRLDAEGFLYIVDRKKDMILSGAQNIYPADIEAVMRTHPEIEDEAVVGVRSIQWGETPGIIPEPLVFSYQGGLVKGGSMSGQYAEIGWQSRDGLRLYARVYAGPGAGAPTVLCLHGLTRNSRDFEDLAPHLQRHYRVIAPDLRGRGFSARDPQIENYQPGIYVEDILALLGTLGAPRIAVIGTSLGGILAMMLGLSVPGLEQDRWQVLARRGFREDAAGAVELDADPGIGEVLRAAPAGALDLWPLWKALRSIPTLAIRGARSDILSAPTFARMKSENPSLEQLEVANRGHVPLLDERECIAALDAFLARILSAPPA